MLRLCCLMPVSLLLGCLSDSPSAGLSLPQDFAPRPPAVRLPQLSGKLVGFAKNFRQLQKQCLPLVQPSDLELATAQQAVAATLSGELGRARELFASLELEFFELVDQERRYLVATESLGKPLRGWGFLVFNPQPRRQLILEAPHPRHDRYTGEQAAELMQALDARALLISTSYRCSSTAASSCSGRTRACRQIWSRGRYRSSDMAHVPRSIFHAAHQALLDLLPGAVAVQLHGFHRRPGLKRHLIISDGTRLPGSASNPANRLAGLLRSQLSPKFRQSVRSCNERNNQGFLCATHNVQGRYANNSAQPCRHPARYPTGRFLHIEQSIEARRPGGRFNPQQLRLALAEFWPPEAKQAALTGAQPTSSSYPLLNAERPSGLSLFKPLQQGPLWREAKAPAIDLVSVQSGGQNLAPPSLRLVGWGR